MLFVQRDSALTSHPSGNVKALILLLFAQGLERDGRAKPSLLFTRPSVRLTPVSWEDALSLLQQKETTANKTDKSLRRKTGLRSEEGENQGL